MKSFLIRPIAYALLAIALYHLAYFEAVTLPHFEQFAELGYTELTHTLLLLSCCLMFVLTAWRIPEYRPLVSVLALGFGVLMVRENDQILELFLPHGFWKWPAGVLLTGLVWVVITRRELLLEQARSVSESLASGVMFAGLSALIFSRFFGQTSFWEAVMEERYWRVVKTAAEESIELFGIGLLTAGAFEMCFELRKRVRSSGFEPG